MHAKHKSLLVQLHFEEQRGSGQDKPTWFMLFTNFLTVSQSKIRGVVGL
jgi:hypothetical protein